MKKRFIFDLDGTLLTGDYHESDQYLIDVFGDAAHSFLGSMSDVLGVYERTFLRYDYDDLSRYLRMRTGLPMTPEIVREWDSVVGLIHDTEEKHVRETLEYLKSHGKSLAVLTNWFGNSQKERLRRADLLKYFDSVYGGEIATKPHKQAYFIATGDYHPQECIFIGDNPNYDYIGPRACAMDSVLYDKDDSHHKTLVKVRSLNELKKIK